MLISVLAFAFLVAGSAVAQSTTTVTPLSIFVNPAPSFGVEVSVNRDPSGNGTPIYFVGDPISVMLRVTENAYVYLFNVNAVGEVTQFFPNRFSGPSSLIRVGETVQIPARGARFQLSIGGPFGTDQVIAVASRRPLDTSTLASFTTTFRPDASPNPECRADCFAVSPRPLGSDEIFQTLTVLVEPLPQADWVTDTVRFQIRQR